MVGREASEADQILTLTASAARSSLQAGWAVILGPSQAGRLQVVAAAGFSGESPVGLEVGAEPGESVYAVAPGNVTVVEDLSSTTPCRVMKAAMAQGARSLVAVPVVAADHRVGTLAVHFNRTGGASAHQVQALQALAAVAGVALGKGALLPDGTGWSALTERARRALRTAPTLDDGTEALVRLLRAQLGCEHVWVLLRYGLTVRGRSGDVAGEPHVIELRIGEGLVGHAAQTGETLLVDDVATDPRYIAGVLETRSELCVPIKVGDRVVGVINAESYRIGAFTPAHAQGLEEFAAEVGTDLEQLKLRDDTFHRSRREAAVLELAGRILAPNSQQAVLEEILDQIRGLFGYELCAILLIDSRTGELYSVAMRGFPEEAASLRFPLGLGIVGHVAETGRPYYGPDTARDPYYRAGDPKTRSELALPLIVDGRVIGVLNVESHRPGDFPPEVHVLLEALAALAALAIHRARLTEDLRRLGLTDELTGLANRRALLESLSRETAAAARTGLPLSVVMVEVDGFKRVNDGYGHLKGDEILVRTAMELKASLRAMDLCARYGGDEFVLVLPNTSTADALVVAERLRSRLPDLLPADKFRITFSIGVAGFPGDGTTPERLLEAADLAMYTIKRRGGDGVGVAQAQV